MNDYASLRKKNNGTFVAVVALALCVIMSATIVFSRLAGYSAYQTKQYIPLTVSNAATKVTTMQRQAAVSQAPMAAKLSATSQQGVVRLDETKPGPTDTAWLTITELELFCASYENGEGKITVNSDSGDNVVAPGTSHSFTFALQNTAEFGLDYDIEVEAYFEIDGGNEAVPVEIRLYDYNGNYLIGSPDGFEDLSDVNMASGSGSISAGYIAPYVIEWQWPFEGDDVYDTFLGDYFLETEVQVSFVMEIRTIAEKGGDGGLPETGDRSLVVPIVAMSLSAPVLLFLVIPGKRKREDNNASK